MTKVLKSAIKAQIIEYLEDLEQDDLVYVLKFVESCKVARKDVKK